MDTRRFLEDLGIALACELHLSAGPRVAGGGHAVLPFGVIPGMDADFKAFVAYMAHHIARTRSNVGTRQQRAVEQGAHAVVLHDGGSLHLADEAGAENAPDGAAGMIRPQAEQKGRADAVTAQHFDEVGHAFARATQCVDVDLECKNHD